MIYAKNPGRLLSDGAKAVISLAFEALPLMGRDQRSSRAPTLRMQRKNEALTILERKEKERGGMSGTPTPSSSPLYRQQTPPPTGFFPSIKHGWKGWSPPQQECIHCRQGKLRFTGRRNKAIDVGRTGMHGLPSYRWDRIYKCDLCGAEVGAPTMYVWCLKWEGVIEEDKTGWLSCMYCPLYPGASPDTLCTYWLGRMQAEDQRIENSLRKAGQIIG